MTDKSQVEQQRKTMREALERALTPLRCVDDVMKGVKHPRGQAYRSLKPRSEEYITHSDNSMCIAYRAENGELYEINISRREQK